MHFLLSSIHSYSRELHFSLTDSLTDSLPEFLVVFQVFTRRQIEANRRSTKDGFD